jgi:hypothetical protein
MSVHCHDLYSFWLGFVDMGGTIIAPPPANMTSGLIQVGRTIEVSACKGADRQRSDQSCAAQNPENWLRADSCLLEQAGNERAGNREAGERIHRSRQARNE